MREPWIIAGDFNAFLHGAEKCGGPSCNSGGCKKFLSWIKDYNMKDMGFIGTKFTWKRGMTQERLDRFI